MRKIFFLLIAVAFLLMVSQPVWSQMSDRPKIGLALSGGGARGAAHIGVLKALEEQGIPIDYIAGTSVGAIIGGFYASGYTTDEIEAIVNNIDFAKAFDDDVTRDQRSYRRKKDDRKFLSGLELGVDNQGIKLPRGAVTGQSIELILSRAFAPVSHVRDFNLLDIPFRAVAADLETGEEYVISSGSLDMAVRASMSLPVLLEPVEYQGKLLVDGGIANNLPISVVREMGADIVIAVDITTPLNPKESITDFITVTDQLVGFLTATNTTRQIETLSDKDFLVTPQLGEITSGNFDLLDEAMPLGIAAINAHPQLSRLQTYAVDSGHDSEDVKKTVKLDIKRKALSFVTIINETSVNDRLLYNKIKSEVGKPIDLKQLERDINAIYGLGHFSNVNYSLITQGEETGIEIRVKGKAEGKDYIQLGLSFSSSEDIDNNFNLYGSYVKTNINRLSGELRADLALGTDRKISFEWYQPLAAATTPFIDTRLAIGTEQFNFFNSDLLVAEVSVEQFEFELAGGIELGNWGELKLGGTFIDGKTEQKIGPPVIPDTDFDDSQAFVSFGIDTLDNLSFPRDGFSLSSRYMIAESSLGADLEYSQSISQLLFADSWGANTLLLGAKYKVTDIDAAPVYASFRAGGFLNLSGYQRNQLTGDNFALAYVAYNREFGTDLFKWYVGGSLERGNVWSSPQDLSWKDYIDAYSIYIGTDTPFGPVFIGAGKNEESSSLYLVLDQVFD